MFWRSLYLPCYQAVSNIIIFQGSIHYRARIIPLLPGRIQSAFPSLPARFASNPRNAGYSRVPNSFADQAAQGLSSAAFDLEQNIFGDDSRVGLDEAGTQEVMEIMRAQGVR